MKPLTIPLLLVLSARVFGQTDLLKSLKDESTDFGYTTSTFKSTRVINSQSVETIAKGNLDFRISHRFGRINSGAYNFFGLDEATIRLGLEYGLTDAIMIGLGRSSNEKAFDGFTKFKIARQRHGDHGAFPVSITWFSNIAIATINNSDPIIEQNGKYRYSYAHQLIIARKFNSSVSLQVAPILIHQNLTASKNQANDSYAISTGGRVKITKRLSVNAEYIYRIPNFDYAPYHNSLSLGVDIETGGHVFQLHVTNSQGMIEEMFVNRTDGQLLNGDLFYGFNISRQFTIGKRK